MNAPLFDPKSQFRNSSTYEYKTELCIISSFLTRGAVVGKTKSKNANTNNSKTANGLVFLKILYT